jgi:hypothetical protein
VRRCRWHTTDPLLADTLNLLLGPDPADAECLVESRHAPDQDWLRAMLATALIPGTHIVRGHTVPPAPEGVVDG